MSVPSQAPDPGQLMDEALKLAEDLDVNIGELQKSGLDAIQLIEAQQAASHSKGTVAKFGHILASSRELSGRMRRLLDMAQSVLRESINSHYEDEISRLFPEIEEINPLKIANEDLLRELERRRDNLLAEAEVTSTCAAAAVIPIFSLAFSHSDLLHAFVGKPPLSRRALHNASVLASAAAADFVGTVIPFFGTIITVFQLLDPWIEREKQRVVDAIPLVDRLFNFDDGLTTLLGFSALIEGSLHQVAEFLRAYRKSFDEDIRWLTEVARAAR